MNQFSDDRMKDVPIGLTLSMAMDEKALNAFARMSEAQRQAIIERARRITSKSEMMELVQDIEQSE